MVSMPTQAELAPARLANGHEARSRIRAVPRVATAPAALPSLAPLGGGAFLDIGSWERLHLLDVLRIHRFGAAETCLVRSAELIVLVRILRRQQALAGQVVRNRSMFHDAFGRLLARV